MSELTQMQPGTSAVPGDLVLISRPVDGVCVVTLNREHARNALSIALMTALRNAIAGLALDTAASAIVLAARGPVFCSGHDLKEITARRADADGGKAFFAETMALCAELMQAIVACPKPVIAAVQGTATAAGCQLVATCDLAVAAASAQFCTPGVNIGLFCSTPMVALSRNVPRKRAMEMLLLGEMLPAVQAAEYGLVNRVVAPGNLMEAALAFASQIAAKPAATVAIGKQAFYRQLEMGLADAYHYAAAVMVENMMMREAEEGIGAFTAKRKPDWKGC